MSDKEIFKVYLFNKTGLSVNNSPDSLDNLMRIGANNIIRVDDIYRLQPYVLDTISVKGTFYNLQSIDYVILDNPNFEKIGYFVTNINMVNVNNAKITLMFDAIGTLGLGYTNKYEILSGWCKRRHYTKAEDTLFANTLAEEFLPTLPTEFSVFEVGYSDKRTNLIASTISLADSNGKLQLDINELRKGNSIILKPIVKGTRNPTIVTLPENKTTGGLSQTVQSLCIYDGELLDKDIMNTLNAYNLLDVITASYQVPSDLLEVSSKNGPFFQSISGSGKGITTNLSFKYGTAKNMKVFALSSTYTFMSIISGDTETFRAYEIYTKGFDNLRVNLMADLTPGGKPYLRPEYYYGYKGEGMTSYYKTVQGASWSNIPIITDGKNGYAYNQLLENNSNAILGKEISTLTSKLYADKSAVELSNAYSLNSLLSAKESGESQSSFYADTLALANLQDLGNKSGVLEKSSSFVSKTLGNLGLTSGKLSTEREQQEIYYNNKLNSRQVMANEQLNQSNLMRINNTTNLLSSNKTSQLNYLDVAYANTISIMKLKRAQELTAFNVSNMISSPNVTFATTSNLQNFVGNGFVIIQERLSKGDIERFDDYLTNFGYASNEKMKTDFFKNRPLYNFVQVGSLKIKPTSGRLPQYLLDLAEAQLMVGVRVWHVLPNSVTQEQYNTN